MKQIDVIACSTEILTNLKAGAFLTVKNEELLNTMTISWGFLGIMWGKPSFIVAVRTTRYTYGIIEKAKDFSVSIPVNTMSAELAICGSKSGRDIDKFKEAKISTQPSQKIGSPIIACPGYHLECKMAYKAPITSGVLEESYQSFYAQKDYHTHYFGEIVAGYKTE